MRTKFSVWLLVGLSFFLVFSFVYGQEIKIKKPFEPIPPGKKVCYYVERINRIEVKPVPFVSGDELRIFVAVQVRSALVNSFNYEAECEKYTRYLTYFVYKVTEDGHEDWYGEWKDNKGNWTSDYYVSRNGSPRLPISIGTVKSFLLLERKEGEQIFELPSIRLPLVFIPAPASANTPAVEYEKLERKYRISKIIIEARLHITEDSARNVGEYQGAVYDWTRLSFSKKFVLSEKKHEKDPDIYKEGTLQLYLHRSASLDVDLDKGMAGDKGDVPSADFVWAGGGGSKAYDGVYFYIIGKVDLKEVSYSDLLSYSYKLRVLSDVLSNPNYKGTVIAYLTSEGRYGKFKIEDMDSQYLKITYITYAPSIIGVLFR